MLLRYIFIFTTYFSVPFFCIVISEYFEDWECLQHVMKNSNGELLRVPIVILRLLILMGCLSFLVFSDSLTEIFSVGGALFCPVFIGFPVNPRLF